MTTLLLPIENALANINYIVYCPEVRECCVIDPFDPDLILDSAERNHLKITHIINTHEHWDHTQGNELLKAKTNAKIMAHHDAQALIPGFDKGLSAGEIISIGESIKLTVLETPGHTLHSICLYNNSEPGIYTGDTLFNCGCGNCHHGGDVEKMFETFETQLSRLPNNTKLYPGHDYLRNNLKFAQSLQPNLSAITTLLSNLKKNETHISTLAEDKTIDPFFRLDDLELKSAIGLDAQADRKTVFTTLRQLRNKW